MNLEVEYVSGSKFTAKSRSHTIVSDQPIETGGSDTGNAVHSCLIHNTLVQPPAIDIVVHAGSSDTPPD